MIKITGIPVNQDITKIENDGVDQDKNRSYWTTDERQGRLNGQRGLKPN